MRPPPSADSREKLLFHLKTKGPQTAGELARRLGVTPMAVRQHLARLGEEGLVAYADRAGRVGRPRRVWRVTAAADGHFPDSHAELALGMLEATRATFGAEGLKKLVAARTEAQIASYRARMPGARAPLAERVAALAAIRREEGYMAEWGRAPGGGFRLFENHCPICTAARACVGLCEGELELFRRVLGPRITVERTEYVLEGDRRCTYEVR